MIESPATPRRRQPPASPVSAAEVAATRQPSNRAHLLPGRVFHDPAIFSYEQEAWFAGGWVSVGREEDAARPGQYFLASVAGEPLVVVRGNDGVLRAFYNVCRHRGATILEEECGTLARFQCPYHAWIYDLEGRLRTPRHTELLEDFDPAEWGLVPARLGTWQGIVYLDLSGEAPPLEEFLGDLPAEFARWDLGALRRARRIDYDVKANWKALVENYEECYHCPGVHPQLNKITPYNLGDYFPWNGPFIGSWMEVLPEYETLSMTGDAAGRPPIPGMTDADHNRIFYFVIWPNQLLSLHPDYLMLHWVFPLEPGQTLIRCEWYFDPVEMAKPDFDPSDAIEFWDLTNRQDWHVCELQQQGTKSRAYSPGRYSAIESSVHGFDLMVADRYAGDGVITPQGRIAKQDSADALATRAKRRARSAAAD
ncbi:MAG TPA: aromatic ring-hydroxylating dioxygenase subunit alpha [Thermomicrobiales bacterium]|nr:aromatic ring-hydroxylating dioxygenase subunit alpha [Thermomicrobiales bacterium]